MTSLRSELIIDPTIVQENINYLKKLIPVGSKFMAVIKSDAYGHIMENLLEHIDDFVDGYGTVRIDEAIRIREASNKKILLIGCDLRNPQLHKHIYEDKNAVGLVNFLVDPAINWRDSVLKKFDNHNRLLIHHPRYD